MKNLSTVALFSKLITIGEWSRYVTILCFSEYLHLRWLTWCRCNFIVTTLGCV